MMKTQLAGLPCSRSVPTAAHCYNALFIFINQL